MDSLSGHAEFQGFLWQREVNKWAVRGLLFFQAKENYLKGKMRTGRALGFFFFRRPNIFTEKPFLLFCRHWAGLWSGLLTITDVKSLKWPWGRV